MSTAVSEPTNQAFDTLLKGMIGANNHAGEFYRFFQERVEKIRMRLWTTLTWLAGVQGALLALQRQPLAIPKATLSEPMVANLLAITGMFLAAYMVLVVGDGTKHIESNWHSADVALGSPAPHPEHEFLKRLWTHKVFGLMAVLGAGLFFAHMAFLFPSKTPPSQPAVVDEDQSGASM